MTRETPWMGLRWLVLALVAAALAPVTALSAGVDDPREAPAPAPRHHDRPAEEVGWPPILDPWAIGLLEKLAGWLETRDHWPAALSVRHMVLARYTKTRGPGDWRTVDARWALARAEAVRRLDATGRRRFAEADGLFEKAETLYSEGRYSEAFKAAQRVAALRRELLGELHPAHVDVLEILGSLRQAQGEHVAARPLLALALALRKDLLGERHPEYATSLNNLGLLCWEQGDYAAARPLIERALALRKDLLGERHLDYAASLNNLGLLFWSEGDYATARPLYDRALDVYRAGPGERHPDAISCLNNLAKLLEDQGDYASARPLYERALALREDVLGGHHPLVALSLDNLATLLHQQGDYAAARPLLERALAMRKDLLGERHPDYRASLDNLATLFEAQGDYAAARPLFEQALMLRGAVLGEQSIDYAVGLNNLGLLCWEQGDYAAARPLYERALALRKALQGEHNLGYAVTINNLGLLHQAQGDYAAARPLLERALALRKEFQGEHHLGYALALNNLASVLVDLSDFAAARPLLERAVELREQLLGPGHPEYATTLDNLAGLLWAEGNLAGALEQSGRALRFWETFLAHSLFALSERERLNQLRAGQYMLNTFLSLSAGGPGRVGESYAHLLAQKGLATEAVARGAAERADAGPLRAQFAVARARLNALYYARVPPGQADDHARRIRAQADEMDRLGAELARALGVRFEVPTPEQVAAVLPAGAALVDLLVYTHYEPPRPGRLGFRGEDRYVAFVLRSSGPPERIDLGPAELIDEAIVAWRERLRDDGRDSDELGREVARLIWEPLKPRLEGIRTVLVAPDGGACFLPWAALPDDSEGSYLLRRYAFGIVPSARQLVARALRTAPPASGGLLASGGVDYGRAEREARPVPPVVASRSAQLDRAALSFAMLPGTAAEARDVVARFGGRFPGASCDLLDGAGATKARLRAAMPGRRYLHLATHGYFAPPEMKSALAPEDDRTALRSWEGMTRGEVVGYYPGLLSGLVWAGAADPPTDPATGALDRGAGLMTAEEVAGLDLRGCELAVLSACETGLGRTAGGEGVLGLQRAFGQAGCRAVIASLWKVDDEATRALMGHFYRDLWEGGLPPLEALRRAQLRLLDDPGYGAGGRPRLWAAWVLSGEPGGLPRGGPAPPGGGP